MAGTSAGEIRLRQNVLHAHNRTHLALLVHIFELVCLVWLKNDLVTPFKLEELVLQLELSLIVIISCRIGVLASCSNTALVVYNRAILTILTIFV